MIDNNVTNLVEVVNKDSNLNFRKKFSGSGNEHILDILIENVGRLNFGHEINNQRKGLNGEVLIEAKVHKKWEMFPIEFKENFIEGPKTEK
jgi:beta-galactosidase